MGYCRAASVLVALFLTSLSLPVAFGDTVISSEEVEILQAGNFQSPSEWSFETTTGFSTDQAEYTIGMVADGEMSFTHARPDNFAEYTSWASVGCSSCNATFGEADGFYSWSRGPDITMGGYSYSGLDSMEIEHVSLVLHISIPDALPSDEVNVIMQNHGSDILVTTFARTLGPLNRMINPLVVNLDSHLDWDWSKLEQTQFNVDYVSDNQGADDSEVRIDAVGLRVKYHQPWFSFENARAEHSSILEEVPVIDISTYDGEISGLEHSTCGLVPSGEGSGIWEFRVSAPSDQKIGRVHVSGVGNYSILFSHESTDGEYVEIDSGDLVWGKAEIVDFRILVEDGCISGSRVDLNDPHLIVSGRVSGSFAGLSSESSNIRFAIGSFLVHTEQMDSGEFEFSVPVGFALPPEGEALRIGVAARFQWSSNGTSENTVVHIGSMSISGGFSLEWDRAPNCEEIADVSLIEDEGGEIISVYSICSDDITDPQSLEVRAHSSDNSTLFAYGEGGLLMIEPEDEASGTAEVFLQVIDEVGNSWTDSFVVEVEPVMDPPEFVYVPGVLYIELGESGVIAPEIFDPDTESLSISTSKSWASVNGTGEIFLQPVETGEHVLTISVTDGNSMITRDVVVIVTSKPDLLVESMEIRIGGLEANDLENGDVVEVIGFIRNQGRSTAQNVSFYCMLNGILVGTGEISELDPGGLSMATCDIQLIVPSEVAIFTVEIDGTNSIEETNEGNNVHSVEFPIGNPSIGPDDGNASSTIVALSVVAILFSLAAFQMSPKSPKKEFRRRK